MHFPPSRTPKQIASDMYFVDVGRSHITSHDIYDIPGDLSEDFSNSLYLYDVIQVYI